MNAEEDIFAKVLFEKYRASLDRLQAARKARYEKEVEMKNLQEDIEFLQYQIGHQVAHEIRLNDDVVRAERESEAYRRGKDSSHE